MKIVKTIAIYRLALIVLIICSSLPDLGETVIVILSKGVIRNPKPGRKPSTSAAVSAVKVRRHDAAKAWVRRWLKRVLRKGGLRSKAYYNQQHGNNATPRYNGSRMRKWPPEI